MFMNQSEIEIMAANRHTCPNVRKGVQLLYRLMEAVNAQSDGWAYWAAPSKSAEKLEELLRTAGNLWYDTRGTISDADFKKAVAPIKAMVTREKKRQLKYGNKFDFDVVAAIAEADEAVRST